MISEAFEKDYRDAFRRYHQELKAAQYQAESLRRLRVYSHEFLAFLERGDAALANLGELGKAQVFDYVDSLPKLRNKKGRKLTANMIRTRLGVLRAVLRYFHAIELLPRDLSVHVGRVKVPAALPRHVPTTEEMKRLLSLPKANLKGRRDQVLLELLYGTGIRRAEAAALDTYDLDFEEKTILIRKGKGARERKVPMGAHLMGMLDEYLRNLRPQLLRKHEGENALFLDHLSGGRLSTTRLGYLVIEYLKAAGLSGGPHVLRHAFATHLLKNGANIFYIQRLLGHKTLDSTDIYTRVYPADLLKAVGEFHPRSHEAVPVLTMPIRRSKVRLPYLMKLKTEGKALDPEVYTYEKLAARSREGL